MSVIGKILVKLGLDSSEFTRGTRDAGKSTQDFVSKAETSFKKLLGLSVFGYTLKNAFNFGKEAYMAAAQAEGVKIAFDRLNDPNLLNNLKSATKGTVDELKLMQLSVQAKNFKLPVEQLGTYLKFATKRAQETGMSVDYLTNSIITGLGRKSVLILDNLGVSAVEIREEMKKGGDMAQAVGRIIQREMAKAGDITETAAIKAEKISAKWSDFMGNLGNTGPIQKAGGAIQDFLISVIDGLNDALTYNGKTSIDNWIAKNITNPLISAEDQLKNLNIQLDHSKKRLEEMGEGSASLWVRGFQKIGSKLVKAVTLGSYDPDFGNNEARDFERAARMEALDAYNAQELRKKGAAKIKELTLEKVTDEQLLELKKIYSNHRIGYEKQVSDAIAEEQKKRIDKQIEADEKAIEDAKKRDEEIAKAQLSYKESENKNAITQLKKQAPAYGNTIVYMEQMLKLRREQEQYAQSDAEYNRIKKENDALEKQITLRKNPVDYQKGSELDLKSQLSDAEAEMSKLNTRTDEGKKRFLELSKIIKNKKWEIEHQRHNIKIDFEVNTAELSSEINDQIQETLDAYDNGVGAMLDKQREFAAQFSDILEKGAEASIASLGVAIGALANGDTDAIWQTLLNPIADMAIQLGELAIATGIGIEGIKASFESMNPYVAVAAGIALVALGTAIKGAVGNIGKGGGGSSSSGYGNTFTGGYSNSGAYSNSGVSKANTFSNEQQQVVVLETRVNGSDLILVQSKEQNRRNR